MTQLIVLGLLDKKPMSGYDIQMTLQEYDAEIWSGVLVGSIYHALKKLEKDGYLEVDSIEQTGLRQKAIFKITESGKLYLKELILQNLEKSSANFPTSFYSAMTFIEKLPKEQAITALMKQRDLLETELKTLDKDIADKKNAMGNTLPPIVSISFQNMYAIVNQQKNFIEQIIELLK